MPSFIVISSKIATVFDMEAKIVLESHKFSELHTGTYIGMSSAASVATKLKNLESYRKNKSVADIKVYCGNLIG
ncbi:hypothetical protein [Vibrio owensii]|uniref:hypothetical protein n=1 Tax=Vibrio owensii TaxID=696485 RepID=UPI003AAEBE63